MIKHHTHPTLAPLLPVHYATLSPCFIDQTNPLCGYSLGALIVWKTHVYYPAFCLHGSTAIIARLFPGDPSKSYLILPVPHGNTWSPSQLNSLCQDHGINQVCFADEAYITRWGRTAIEDHFTIHEQTDYEDYVYLKEDLAELKGNKFSKKRNLINQFSKVYVETNRVHVEHMTPDNKEECKELLAYWWNLRPQEIHDDEDAFGEKVACTHALDLIGNIPGLRGILLRIDGNIKAFGIASDLTGTMADFNFEKADPSVKGLYQFFDRQCARMLFPESALINKECDMDDPGLRHAKRSYHPHQRFKSYAFKRKG